MKALAMMRRMEINTTAKGLGSIALDAGVGAATSYGIGQVYTRYGSKAVGKHIAKITGAAGKILAAGCSVMSGGHQTFLGNVFNSMGQAGINAYALEKGLEHGRKAVGVKAFLAPSGTDIKKISGASEMTSIGALGRAAGGRGLSWDQIEEIAAGH